MILVMLETSHRNDKALPEAQAPLTESMNVGQTMKESCDTEERHAGEAYDGGSSVMSSKLAAVGRVREAAAFCMERLPWMCSWEERPFLWILVFFPDSHITRDYKVFLPPCPGGFVCFLHFLFICFFISFFNNPTSG